MKHHPSSKAVLHRHQYRLCVRGDGTKYVPVVIDVRPGLEILETEAPSHKGRFDPVLSAVIGRLFMNRDQRQHAVAPPGPTPAAVALVELASTVEGVRRSYAVQWERAEALVNEVEAVVLDCLLHVLREFYIDAGEYPYYYLGHGKLLVYVPVWEVLGECPEQYMTRDLVDDKILQLAESDERTPKRTTRHICLSVYSDAEPAPF